MVGVIVNKDKGGWESLVAFVHSRDIENRDTSVEGMSKKKGSRELQNLACSINFEGSHSRCKEIPASSRNAKRNKGSGKFCP